MIRVDRGPEPEFLRGDSVKLAIEKLEEFYSSTDRSQKRYDFPFNKEIDGVLKRSMHEVFHGKCGYCEVKINSVDQGYIDRFRPHSGIRDGNKYYPDLYWWLTFKWDNLIYCCRECQQYKDSYFHIKGQRAMTVTDDLSKEDCVLVDPCKDDPELLFSYDRFGNIIPLTERGRYTIYLLRLNRPSHKMNRALATDEMDVKGSSLLREFDSNPSIEFLGFKRWYLQPALKRTGPLQDRPYFSSKKAVTSDFFPIEYIRIQNFKGISDLTIHFKTDEVEKRSWLFLLGENGVGKSSILQAIAVGIRNNEHVLTPLLPGLIQKGKDRAEITIKERDSDNILTTVLTKEKITQTGEFNSFLIGYGSLRLSVDEADKNLPQDKAGVSYENLFRPIRPLNDITDWLKNTYKDNRKFFDIVAYSIKQLLPHDFPGNDLTIENGEILFRNSNKLFSELSDGFKSTIILAVDIMMKLSSAQADMDKLSGIVLIDELGNQLHPRWQMRIVKQLRTVFKNINFVVSTHHPLCLRGSEKGEILLLKQEDNQVAPVTELPDPASLRVDQILSSEFFGLNSLIDPELEAKFNRYYQLLAKGVESLEGVEQKELGNLKNELRNQKQLGASLREELMYTVIDSLLASKTTLSRSQLKEQVVSRVKDIWDKLNSSSHDQG